MNGKRFTFILIPPNDGQVQQYRLAPRFLALAGMAAFIFLCAFGYYFYSRADYQETLAQLRAENGELSRSIEYTRGMVGQLETVILDLQREAKVQDDSVSQLENRLRESEEGWKHFPTISPVSSGHSWVSSRFGYRSDPFTGRSAFHAGLDFAGRTGTPIYATADGMVSDTNRDTGLGNLVVIDHDIEVTDESGKSHKKEGIYQTEYGHLEKILVSPGQRVTRGQQIATMGNTGRSTGPHLHYAVLYKDQRMGRKGYMDPENFILDLPSATDEKTAGIGPTDTAE